MNHYNKANICFNCKNSVPDDCGHGCPWSRKFEPIPGWTAEPTTLKVGYGQPVETYHITACPMFDRDDRSKHEYERNKPVRIRCVETGVVYQSLAEAARKVCGKSSSAYISEQIRHGRSYACGYHWEVVEDDEYEE